MTKPAKLPCTLLSSEHKPAKMWPAWIPFGSHLDLAYGWWWMGYLLKDVKGVDADAFLCAGSAMVLGPALLVGGGHDFVSLLQSVLFLLCSFDRLVAGHCSLLSSQIPWNASLGSPLATHQRKAMSTFPSFSDFESLGMPLAANEKALTVLSQVPVQRQ